MGSGWRSSRCNGAVSFSGLQCGLVLDEWTESVPAKQATTGVAFHFNRPNATAPQALLLAVPPVVRGDVAVGRAQGLASAKHSSWRGCARSSPRR